MDQGWPGRWRETRRSVRSRQLQNDDDESQRIDPRKAAIYMGPSGSSKIATGTIVSRWLKKDTSRRIAALYSNRQRLSEQSAKDSFGMGIYIYIYIWLAKSENMEARQRCSSRQGGTRGNRGKEAWANGKVIQGWSGRAVWKDCLGASPELSYPALTPHTC